MNQNLAPCVDYSLQLASKHVLACFSWSDKQEVETNQTNQYNGSQASGIIDLTNT
jgi:hypothetical protein